MGRREKGVLHATPQENHPGNEEQEQSEDNEAQPAAVLWPSVPSDVCVAVLVCEAHSERASSNIRQ